MSCFFCKGEFKKSTTTHFVELNKCMVIIKNVPCLECVQCGETYFENDVVERLDNIVKSVSNFMTEIAVIEYNTDKVA